MRLFNLHRIDRIFISLVVVYLIVLGFSFVREKKEFSQPQMERIYTLPYLEYSEDRVDPSVSGVTIHDERDVQPGVILIDEYLINLSGHVIKEFKGMVFKPSRTFFLLKLKELSKSVIVYHFSASL